MDQYKDQLEEEKLYKVKLFIYPDWKRTIPIFDVDEEELQNQEAMMVLCARQQPGNQHREKHTAYVWTGSNFEVSAAYSQQAFVHKCIEAYFGEQEAKGDGVKIVAVDSEQPCEEFMYFFDVE